MINSVGASVGVSDGALVGDNNGIKVGSVVICVGSIVGANDGAIVGSESIHDTYVA
eukprot:CAMPEP_0114692618 /NCGR_PEP_ID=MMETSP0191-20121206/68150_1 /TAXON_ID=126664 /ORGANISM="Sorites sp." /LENGTH=55 /DNA_ID=CAMNT_0001985265 /DNA_START=133 /DNA_END=300 /DNA_ORIENTATION=-